MALTTLITGATPQTVTYNQNGYSQDVNNVTFPLQSGVPVSPIYSFRVVPATSTNGNIAPNFNFGTAATGGNATLSTVQAGTAPNISSIPYVFNGKTGVLLDCERGISIDFSHVTTLAFYVTVYGYDYRGVQMTYTSTTFATNVTSANIECPFAFIYQVTFSANPLSGLTGQSIEIQSNGFIGLPYLLPSLSKVISCVWNNATVAISSGEIVPGFVWRNTDPSVVNYSARGVFNASSPATNGTIELVLTYYVYGADGELNAEIINQNQSSLKIVGIQKNDSSVYPNPVFVYDFYVDQDLVGCQINPSNLTVAGGGGDIDFLLDYYDFVAA